MQTKENKMGVMPIDKLLISMSLPMMISMLVQALYNIVDSIFVSRINEYALRAVSLAFPVQSLMIAVAVGTAVGINAFLSKTLGEKNFEKANIIARNGIFIAIVSYVAFAVIGIGWAAINVNSYPMIVEMSKGSDIGKFTGTYYTFSMAAQILTPILSGFLLENVSYRTLFPYAFVFSVLAFITMTQVRHGDARPDKKKSLLENFDVDD